MNDHHSPWIITLAVLPLALGCAERRTVTGPDGERVNADVVLAGDGPFQVKAAVRIEGVGAESTRERVEIAARFSGIDPIDPEEQQVRDLQLRFDLAPAGGTQPCWLVLIRGTAWAVDGGGAFKLEVSDPQRLPAVIRVVKLEDDQVLADLTGELEAVEARLEFLADAKAWSLILELNGIVTPTMVIAPMFHPIVGAVAASLDMGQDRLSAAIREGQALFAASALEVQAAAGVEQVGEETIRERVETAFLFTGIDPIGPGAQPARPRDIQLRFELAPAGGTQPCWLVLIRGTAWAVDGGGVFKLEVSDPQLLPAVIEVLKLENGQVVADLTGEIGAVEARLEFLPDAKAWSLTLELNGIVTTMVIAPMFYPVVGAGMVSLEAGGGLVSAGIREGEAAFF